MAHPATALRAPVAFAPEPAAAAPAAVPPRAGWYPDPERRATTRFFDGKAWTEHTRGPAPLAALTAAAKDRSHGETRAYGRFENRPASAAVIVGAISIVLNPLLITSVIAVVLGVKGLRRSRRSLARYGRERAVAGIVLAIGGVATAAVTLAAIVALLTPAYLHAQHVAQVAAVRAAVVQHVTDRGARIAAIDCPPLTPGTTAVCKATTTTHDLLTLDVLLPATGGAVLVTDPPAPKHVVKHRHR